MPKVTLDDVARSAGVSKATASKALNGRDDVSLRTRQRVERAAEHLGYPAGPHRGASAENGTSTFAGPPPPPPVGTGRLLVHVVVDAMTNHYAGTVLDAVVHEAGELGVGVSVSTWRGTDRSPTPGTPEWFVAAHSEGSGAFIVISTAVDDTHAQVCADLGTPLMLLDPFADSPAGAMSISATNWRGGVQATSHLLELGHRRIATVGLPGESTPGVERLAGYRSALQRAHVTYEPRLTVPGRFSWDDAARLLPLLTESQRPTAVFAASDTVALGVIEVARQAGLRVPHDLSVVGFDDSFAAVTSSPPLTTIRQPLREMGELAVRMTVDQARHPRAVTPPVELVTELVRRDSTAPPPG